MKIKVFGFELSACDGFSLDSFFSDIAGPKGIEVPDQILAVKKEGDFWLGLLLTVKDQKAFCKIRREAGSFTIEPESLGDDRMVDFNYFVIDSSTNRGLYQYYHLSASVGSLASTLKTLFIPRRDMRKAAELEGAKSENEKKAINRRFRGGLHHEIIVRQDKLEERIKTLERIKSIEFGYTTYVPDSNDPLAPLGPYIKRKREKVSFDRSKSGFALVRGVVNFARHFTGRSLKVEGVDRDGFDQIYKLANDHDIFEEFDYDDVVESISIHSEDFVRGLKEQPLIKRMLEIAGGKASALLKRKAID